ncbi:MAG: polysaccharide biosynthesis tyrosine autokinase [Myxococcota bacterium]
MNAPSQQQPQTEKGLNLQELILTFGEYKWLIVGTTILVLAAVVVWTLRQAPIYEATCTIEYDPNPARPLGNDIQDVADPGGSYWTSREFFETQNRVIASRSVAERVVRKLGLNDDPDFLRIPEQERDEFDAIPIERAARRLQNLTTVEMQKNTRIVEIRVRDPDPERASILANEIATVYMEKTLEDRLGSTVSALDWLRSQLDDLQHQLEASELALHSFKQDHNVLSVSMEDRQNIVANNIERLSQSLIDARVRRIELAAHLRQLRAANRDNPLEVNASLITGNETVRALREGYREKAAERAGLAVRYGGNHPAIRSVDAELVQLEDQLRQEIEALIHSAETSLNEARNVEGGLQAALNLAHDEGIELNLREIEYSRLNRERENNSKIYNVLLQRTAETDLTRALRVTHVRVIDTALRPTRPVSPNLPVNAGTGALMGLLLGIGLTLLVSRMDRRLKSTEQIEELGIKVLFVLPRMGERAKKSKAKVPREGEPNEDTNRDLVVHTHPMSSVAEHCRAIRTNLIFLTVEHKLRGIVVTSAGPREGKTTAAANLAISVAHSGRTVLLVDTDLRRPRVHRAFGMQNAQGVTSIVVGDSDLQDMVQHSDIAGLDVLPSGPIPPNPAELFHSAAFRALVETAKDAYDFVIFDSPPLGPVTDPAILAPQTDGVLVVVKSDVTTRDALKSTIRQLRDVQANILGCILNGVDTHQRRYRYGEYYQRDGYYTAHEEEEPALG